MLFLGITISISSIYNLADEFFLFIFLIFLNVLQNEIINFLKCLINILIPFFIAYFMSIIERYFLLKIGFIDTPKTLAQFLLLEIFSYCLIFFISMISLKWIIPWLTAKNRLNRSIICLIPLFFIYQVYHSSFYSDSFRLSIILILSIFSMWLFLIIIFNNIKKSQKFKQDNENKRIEVEYLIKYTEEIQNNYQELRQFKHDYLNILSSLEYFIQQNDLKQLEEYYYSKIQKTGQQITIQSSEIENLKNLESEEIKSILMMKLLLIRQKNIQFSIEIPETISTFASVDIVILVRILGIILDNAIEAVEHDENGKIEIGIFCIDDSKLFVIKNSLKEPIPPLHQLKKEGFSTKGENRGLGLTNVDNLAQQEEYLTINTKINNSWFTQELFIQNEVIEC